MNQETPELVGRLGKLGLVERLTPEELKNGLDDFDLVAQAIRTKSYPRVQGIGDDFLPDIDLYNAAGAVYPLLSKGQRRIILETVLNQMDGIRYDCVNRNHTPYIRDPQLLADISVSRSLYWPGLHDEEDLWKGKSFGEIRELIDDKGLFHLDKVKSDFLVAYALLRSDFTGFGEEYAKLAHPEFLKRVLKGIVALRFARDENEGETEKGRERLRVLLPKSLHDRIEPLRKEADWYH